MCKSVTGQTDELPSGTSRKGRGIVLFFFFFGISRVEAEIYLIQSIPFRLPPLARSLWLNLGLYFPQM